MRLARFSCLVFSVASAFAAAPVLNSVVNSASYVPGNAAPGSLATVFGSGLATTTATSVNFPLPTYLGNATVYVEGVAAPLLYVSPDQINFQIPWEAAGGTNTIVVIVR